MDLDLLSYPADLIPPDVQPALWLRWLNGTRFFDSLYSHDQRCPSNPIGPRCRCLIVSAQICKTWAALERIGKEIGGGTARLIEGMG